MHVQYVQYILRFQIDSKNQLDPDLLMSQVLLFLGRATPVGASVDANLNKQAERLFFCSIFKKLFSVTVCRTPQLASQTGSETASRWRQGAQTTSQ